MRKIAFYIDSMGLGGANRVMANLVSYFHSNGYDVCLINDVSPTGKDKEYSLPDDIKRYFIDNNGKRHNFFCKQFHRLKAIRSILKENETEVIVSFMGPPNTRMLLATLGMKVKKVVSVRNDPYKEYGTGFKRFLARTILCFADGCVFQTQEASEYFPERVKKKSRIIVNPVNEKFYGVTWTGKNKEIAVIGRLQSQKNPLLALKAFQLIVNDFPEYTLVYYGDGELKDEIVRKSKEYKIDSRVVVYGKISDVESRLASSMVYLLSSDYEGMPNALLEAMAVGVPAISTDCPCGGPRSIIQNSSQGELVPCGDAQRMANALLDLLSNKKRQDYMSVHERERAKQFHPNVICSEWENFIVDVYSGINNP